MSNYNNYGDYLGGQFTTGGVTEFQNADSTIYARNVAPDGIVTPSDGSVPTGKAGVVTEDGTSIATGVVSYDQNTAGVALSTDLSDPVARILAGGTAITDVLYTSKAVGMFGTLFFNSNNGNYEYRLDQTKLDALNTGQIATDFFSVIIDDTIHETYVDLQFDVEGNSENNLATPGNGFFTFNEATKTYEVDVTAINDPDGIPSSPGSFTYVWKIDGSVVGSAKGSSYKPSITDNQKPISVEVSYTDQHANTNSETVVGSATIGVANSTPVLANEIADKTAYSGQNVEIVIPDNTFSDPD